MTNTIPLIYQPFPMRLDKIFRDLLNYEAYETAMKTNIYESDNGYLFEIALPGFNKKDISVNLENNFLTIEAKKNENSSIKRSFEIDYKVIEDKISASYENGILRITMPKLVEEKKNINITIA
jgi:HSP20 family protein